jgi:hypothetical protein
MYDTSYCTSDTCYTTIEKFRNVVNQTIIVAMALFDILVKKMYLVYLMNGNDVRLVNDIMALKGDTKENIQRWRRKMKVL